MTGPFRGVAEETLTIAEAARRTGLTAHTLRYYEQQGLMLDLVERTDATHRRYGAGAIAWIGFLTKLRATGMPIRRMREYAHLVGAGEGNEVERLALLDEHRATVRARLDSLAGNLAEIEAKAAVYRDALANASTPVSSAESAQSRAAAARSSSPSIGSATAHARQ
jgi:DNA-binding transcriptional MerR regulator